MDAYAVILAGGKGERFWPLSTSQRPKQLLALTGGDPLMVQAVKRLDGLIPPERIFVITNADLVEVTCQVADMLPKENIIGEPIGRDTAAAAALGCALVKAKDPNAAFCILTADHIIEDIEHFQRTLKEALRIAASEDVLLTIGIQPTEPSTGYGYIEADTVDREADGIEFLRAKRFVEKPDQATAQSYVASGNFFWNSGMFIWSVNALQKALAQHRPALSDMIDRLLPTIGTPAFDAAFSQEYDALEKISIDYALMEKADNIVMAKGTFAWDDVGSWPALENHFDKNSEGNVVIGTCSSHEASGNIVFSNDRLTALVGVDNLVVVQTQGVTLICAKDKAQDVKKIVEQLRSSGDHDEVL